MVDFYRKSTRSVGGLFIAQSHQKYNLAYFNRLMKAILVGFQFSSAIFFSGESAARF